MLCPYARYSAHSPVPPNPLELIASLADPVDEPRGENAVKVSADSPGPSRHQILQDDIESIEVEFGVSGAHGQVERASC